MRTEPTRVSRRKLLQGTALGLTAAAVVAPAIVGVPRAIGAPRILGQAKQFAGQTVTVAGIAGPLVTGPIKKHWQEWGDRTGARVEVNEFPYAELIDKIRASFAAGQHIGDLIQFGAPWMADIMGGGHLLPVPEEIKQKLELDDVVPINREWLLSWGGTMYGIPYDGDYHICYYRRDILGNPDYQRRFKEKYGYDLVRPHTWEEYKDIAEFFNGWDWGNRGKVSYGSSENMARTAGLHWFFASRGAAYAKHPDDPDLFFDRETMKPRINNPGWVRALEIWVAQVPFGPPGRINFGFPEMRGAFVGGDAVLVYEWGDIASEELKPDLSVVNGKVQTQILPGARQVWNSKTNQWDDFPNVSYAPFLAFGGWTHGVTSTTKVAEAAFDFAAFMGSKEMAKRLAIEPDSGVNPGRFSQLEDVAGWVDYGLKEEDARAYLQAIKDTYVHANVAVDMRIPGGSEYYDALNVAAAKALAGEAKPQETLDEAAAKWEEITERYGRDEQRKAYIEGMTLAKEKLTGTPTTQ